MKSSLSYYYYFYFYYCLIVVIAIGQVHTIAAAKSPQNDVDDPPILEYSCVYKEDGYPCIPNDSKVDDVPTGSPLRGGATSGGSSSSGYVCINEDCVVDPCENSIAGNFCTYDCIGKPHGYYCGTIVAEDDIGLARICDGNDACIYDPCDVVKCKGSNE